MHAAGIEEVTGMNHASAKVIDTAAHIRGEIRRAFPPRLFDTSRSIEGRVEAPDYDEGSFVLLRHLLRESVGVGSRAIHEHDPLNGADGLFACGSGSSACRWIR